MAKLTEGEFKYYSQNIDLDKQEHNNELSRVNHPEDIIASYQGRFYEGIGAYKDGSSDGYYDTIVENYLFIAVSTVIPSLFFQLPRIIIRPKREELAFSAAVLNGLANVYFGDDAKRREPVMYLRRIYAVWICDYEKRVQFPYWD